jgi:formylglycine-generating enzyme required for sulfatase activity
MLNVLSWSFRGICAATVCALLVSAATADSFGTGANEFEIDFVKIPGDAGDLGSWPAGFEYTFTGVNRDEYRIGVYEVTNDQWGKFKAEVGLPVKGDPIEAYNESPIFSGTNVPTNMVSWFEAAQFVNWLNTSKNRQPAYRFSGVQGTDTYTLETWDPSEAEGGTNLYRHKDALYYLPTEDEWVKAAYWNGTSLQDYATRPGDTLHQGDGTSGTGWNYYDNGYATDPNGPWEVGSGSEELNGTFDMMGNVQEFLESPYELPYGAQTFRIQRGGSYISFQKDQLISSVRWWNDPDIENSYLGIRIAADVPEPFSLALLGVGGLAMLRRRRDA